MTREEAKEAIQCLTCCGAKMIGERKAQPVYRDIYMYQRVR